MRTTEFGDFKLNRPSGSSCERHDDPGFGGGIQSSRAEYNWHSAVSEVYSLALPFGTMSNLV